MASVDITTEDIGAALRQTVIERVVKRRPDNYVMGPEHDPKCSGYYVPTDPREIRADFAWQYERKLLLVELREVPCGCYHYAPDEVLMDSFGIGELFMMFLGER